MPSDFDDFSTRAHRDYRGWWHFDLENWNDYPPLDVPIDALASSSAR